MSEDNKKHCINNKREKLLKEIEENALKLSEENLDKATTFLEFLLAKKEEK